MDLRNAIRTIPDFPKPGILFRDITSLLENPEAFEQACRQIKEVADRFGYDKIAALDSRGFIFGAPLAIAAGKPLVLVRKPGKLPGETISQDYDLEYGSATVCIHKSSINPGERVLVIDDLMATGGTAGAAAKLVEKAGGTVAGIICVIELPALGGRAKLAPYPIETLVEFEGE